MELSQENRYVVQCFKENFVDRSRGKVIIYGLGINTRAILETLGSSAAVGLMDAACEGETVLGLPVYTAKEAMERGECVVIVARNSVVPIIFERIRQMEEKWSFPIYNIHGERLIHKREKEHFENDNEYWNKTAAELLEKIESHRVISFDIFDTLIVRKCMLPVDVFDMVEEELKKRGVAADGFAPVRREAEFRVEDSYPRLREIYEAVRQRMGWSEACRDMAYQLELETEKKMCMPRNAMCAIFRKTLEMGKRVILTSDMYLAAGEIEPLLEQCGICGYERLFVSCEEKASKSDGRLYEKIRQAGYEEVLHIGDNEKTDGEMAAKGCTDSFTIMSPYEMLVQSSLSRILASADNPEKRRLVGLIQTRLFDDPFCLGREKGLVTVEQESVIGYVFLAPIVSCFLFFLADELRRRKMDKILFCARDGYVIWKLYRKLAETDLGKDLPEGAYFKTSRRAITVPSVESEEDIRLILRKPYNTTMGSLLKARFGVAHTEGDPNAEKMAVSTKNGDEAERYILSYKEEIFLNAQEERRAYLDYMHNNGITDGNNIGIYDFCSGGTLQYYFKKLTKRDVRGIYFATVNIPNTLFDNSQEMSTLFGNIGQYEMKYHLAAHYMYAEAVLTDEHGTLIRYGADGRPVYDETDSSRRSYRVIEEIQKGILTFFDELLEQGRRPDYESLKEFADMLFGCLFRTECCRLTEEIKNVVKAESAYDFLQAYAAWNGE